MRSFPQRHQKRSPWLNGKNTGKFSEVAQPTVVRIPQLYLVLDGNTCEYPVNSIHWSDWGNYPFGILIYTCISFILSHNALIVALQMEIVSRGPVDLACTQY